MLPLELVFADGHLTEIGIATLADGEDAIVPSEARAHAHDCPECAAALGREALHSMALGEMVRATAAQDASLAPVKARASGSSVHALMAGCAVSVIGLLLGAVGTPASFGDRFRDARGLASALMHAARAAFRAELPPAVMFASAALLVCVALVVMRVSPIVRGRIA